MGYNVGYCAIGITWKGEYGTEWITSEVEEEASYALCDALDLGVKFADFDDVCVEATAQGISYFNFMRGLLEVSKMFPALTFDFEGKGEDWDDHFVCRTSNGKFGIKYAELPSVDSITLDYDERELL